MIYKDFLVEIKTKTSRKEIASYFDLESNYYTSKTIRTSHVGNLFRDVNKIQYINPSKPTPESVKNPDDKASQGDFIASIKLEQGNVILFNKNYSFSCVWFIGFSMKIM